MRALDIPGFQALLKKWTQGFDIYYPSQLFSKHPEQAKDL